MKSLLKHIGAAAILFTGSIASAQDVHFSQFYETSLMRNPALAGIFSGDYKIGAMYRSQWSSIGSPYQTALVTGESRILLNSVNDFLTFGVVAFHDKAGSVGLQTTSISPAINYNKSLEDGHSSYLSVGFMGGFVQRSFDPAKMTFDEQYLDGVGFSMTNPTGESLPNPTLNQWDLGAGISFNSSLDEFGLTSYYLGVAGYHLTQPSNTFFQNTDDKKEMKWSANAGFGAKITNDWRFQIHANYQLQGSNSEIIGGGLLSWNKMNYNDETMLFAIHGGAFYRYKDAVIPTLKIDVMGYAFGISYDINVSSLKAATNQRGGAEFSIFKTGLYPPQGERSRTTCPKFYF